MKRAFVIGLLVALLVLFICFVHSLHPHRLNAGTVREQSTGFLAKAGGSEKVCNEAARLFTRFGGAEVRSLSKEDLRDCPALSALGEFGHGVDGIWPFNPTVIKIRFGGHFDGYEIDILDTNSNAKFRESSNTIELLKSRIYVGF
jgi:hypothetical protein